MLAVHSDFMDGIKESLLRKNKDVKKSHVNFWILGNRIVSEVELQHFVYTQSFQQLWQHHLQNHSQYKIRIQPEKQSKSEHAIIASPSNSLNCLQISRPEILLKIEMN